MAKAKRIDPRQGERLNIVKQEQQVSQNELAALVFVTRQGFSDYVTCKTQLPIDAAYTIAEKYGYNPAWLLCLDERKTQAEVIVNDMEKKDESFAAFMILFDDAVKESGAHLFAEERKEYPFDIPQEVKKNMPLHAAPSLYTFTLIQGNKTTKLSGFDLKRLQKHLTRYMKMLIDEAIEEGGADDGEQ